MPNDLSIQTARSIIAGNDGARVARPLPAEVLATGQTTGESLPTPNPTLELDAVLGLVVIQFRNDSGAVTNSIPSQQQLDAYRLWQETKIGPPPNLGGTVAPSNTSAAPPVVTVAPPASAEKASTASPVAVAAAADPTQGNNVAGGPTLGLSGA